MLKSTCSEVEDTLLSDKTGDIVEGNSILGLSGDMHPFLSGELDFMAL